jgi:hypothetical protein
MFEKLINLYRVRNKIELIAHDLSEMLQKVWRKIRRKVDLKDFPLFLQRQLVVADHHRFK